MSDEYKDEMQELLVRYVHAASDMADSLQADLRQGNNISDQTILFLSRFRGVAGQFKKVVDLMPSSKVTLN